MAKRRLGAAAALAAVGAVAIGAGASSADPSATAAAPVNVAMKDNFFKPAKATVKVGGKVKWTNKGQTQHNVTLGGKSSGNVAPGGTTARKFNRAGKFNYVCTLHTGMKGTVKAVK